jgi:hypothetical protein
VANTITQYSSKYSSKCQGIDASSIDHEWSFPMRFDAFCMVFCTGHWQIFQQLLSTADNTVFFADVHKSEEFRVAARLWAGLNPVKASRWRVDFCVCGVDMRSDPWHCLSCNKFTAAWHRRHRLGVERIAAWAGDLGAACTIEPYGLAERDRKRPDGDVRFGGASRLFDFSVIHPGAATYVSGASEAALSAASVREGEKDSKYAALAKANKAQFSPFVLETYGGQGAKATEFVTAVIKAGKATRAQWAPKEVVYGVSRAVAVAVQRGNAAVVKSAFRYEF